MKDQLLSKVTKLRKTANRYRRDKTQLNWLALRDDYVDVMEQLRRDHEDFLYHAPAGIIMQRGEKQS